MKLVDKQQLNNKDSISWAVYHASQQPNIALLPLFYESAHTAAMIRHSKDIVQKLVNHVHPCQTPIISMDQPLYAICKKIQWVFGGPYSEEAFVVMLGPLHTEMALLRLLGYWLTDSG